MTRILTPCTEVTSEEQSALEPGAVISGKYRVEREIGRGGMGVVYEVTHVVMTQRRFAIKWLVPSGGSDSEALRRFRREARVCGAIRHPNVVEVYDVHLEASGSYMVMELLQGESLSQRLQREGALPCAEACRIVRAALSGVAAGHALGVVHRDLKPANLFLCHMPDGPPLPKVVDFGISRVIAPPGVLDTTETRRGTRIGTPLYMAPEQMRGQECDQRTDVYAMGVTLYEALSGRRAFDAQTEAELVYKVLAGEVPPLDTVVRGLPAGLSAVVMRAMALLPEQRFDDALQLSAALERFEKVQQKAASGARESKQSSSHKRRWQWFAGAALGGAAALGSWFWLPRSSSVSEQEAASVSATDQVAVKQEHEASPTLPAVNADAGVTAPAKPSDSTQPAPSTPVVRSEPVNTRVRAKPHAPVARTPAPAAEQPQAAVVPAVPVVQVDKVDKAPEPAVAEPVRPLPRQKPSVRIDSF